MEAVYEYMPMALVFEDIKNDVMIRAVRVKETVKPKLQRHLTFSNVKADMPVVENNEVKEQPVVESDNNDLSDRINKLLEQVKVSATVKRMVLYTKALADKSKRVMEKRLNLKSPVVLTTTEVKVEKDNVIPDTWDKLPEASVVAEPSTIEEPVLPTIEEKVIPPATDLDFNLPLAKPEPVMETKEVDEPAEVAAPIAEKESEEPSLDFTLANIKPVDTEPEKKEEPSLDFLKSWTSRSVSEESQEETKASINVESDNREEFVPTQSSIMARVKRTRNALEDEKTKNIALQDKVQVLEGSNKEYKDKIGVLEAFVKDVVKENGRLTSENNQLKVDKQKLGEKVESISASSNGELDRQKKLHTEEIAKLTDKITSMEQQHIAEKERMSEDFTRKIELSDKRHADAMNALYSTITEALGEPTLTDSEETYTKAA